MLQNLVSKAAHRTTFGVCKCSQSTRLYTRVPKPNDLVRPSSSRTAELIRLGGKKLELNSPELQQIENDLWVIPEFISREEETRLIEEINPLFRKKRYIDTHWDGVITGYKEIEKSFWVRRHFHTPCIIASSYFRRL